MDKKGFATIADLLPPDDNNRGEFDALTPKKPNVPPPADDSQKNSIAAKMADAQIAELEEETKMSSGSTGLPYINLFGFPIDPETIGLIPAEEAQKNQCVVFFRDENQIRVGCVEPDGPEVHDIIANLQHRHAGANVMLYIISPHSFEVAMKLYKNVIKTKKIEYGVKITAEQLTKYQQEISSYEILEKRLPEVNMSEAFAMIISVALNVDASDVHLESEEKNVVVRLRIDGVLKQVAALPKNIWPRLVRRIKGIAGLKINQESIPQDGRITVNLGKDEKLDLRISTLPSAFGESVVFRLLKPSTVGLEFKDLGMRPPVFAKLHKEMAKPNGMIITTGPTGSGKTTTLYAILNRLNTPETKIITLENPIEYRLKGIVQSQVEHSKDYDFAKGLRAILRQDPDIVMVGEIRDLETATTAVEAALTGHLMLSTIHTNDASGAIPRFLGMGVKGIFLAPALNAVIGQRLVRRICAKCKVAYTPGHEQLDRAQKLIANIPENSGEQKPDVSQVKFYKGQGCAACNQTGYKGRIGIYEVFTMSPEIEQQVLSNRVSEYEIKEILHRAGMVTMGQDGILKAMEGTTTLEEVFRVAKE